MFLIQYLPYTPPETLKRRDSSSYQNYPFILLFTGESAPYADSWRHSSCVPITRATNDLCEFFSNAFWISLSLGSLPSTNLQCPTITWFRYRRYKDHYIQFSYFPPQIGAYINISWSLSELSNSSTSLQFMHFRILFCLASSFSNWKQHIQTHFYHYRST